MFRYFLFGLVVVTLFLQACSDQAKKKEQAELALAMKEHCVKTVRLSQEEYVRKFMLHNGDSDADRKEAIKDYLKCVAQVHQGPSSRALEILSEARA